MSKKKQKPRTTCARCGGPFDPVGIERIEFWAIGHPEPIKMEITERGTGIPMGRCVACVPRAVDVVRYFRELTDGAFDNLRWTEAIVFLDDGSKLGSCHRHELFGDN